MKFCILLPFITIFTLTECSLRDNGYSSRLTDRPQRYRSRAPVSYSRSSGYGNNGYMGIPLKRLTYKSPVRTYRPRVRVYRSPKPTYQSNNNYNNNNYGSPQVNYGNSRAPLPPMPQLFGSYSRSSSYNGPQTSYGKSSYSRRPPVSMKSSYSSTSYDGLDNSDNYYDNMDQEYNRAELMAPPVDSGYEYINDKRYQSGLANGEYEEYADGEVIGYDVIDAIEVVRKPVNKYADNSY